MSKKKNRDPFRHVMKDYFATIEDFTDGISNVELLMPAVAIVTRMFAVSHIDQTKKGGVEAKELIYLVEREIIGAWLVKNCQSTVGEGAGILLMGLSPFATKLDQIPEAIAEAYNKRADAEINFYKKLWKGYEWLMEGVLL